jgi:microcystin degradation protein MlrC
MVRILIGECKQEVSTFNPAPSRYADFTVRAGQDVLAAHRGGWLEIGGALSVFDAASDVELVPTYSAHSITSAGTLAAADWARIADEFLAAVRAATPVDAVYLALHGAMAAEGEGDPEGYLLREVRAIVGEQTPIVVSLDLHGILTDRMLRHVDALTAFHTYPHVDFFDTGVRAARLLLRILAGTARPVIAAVPIPALVRGDELITESGLFGASIRAARAIERAPRSLAAALFIGNPFTDVPELRSNSVVISDGDPALAASGAERLARDFWAVRERLQQPLTPLAEAVRLAQAATGTTIMVDAADATSSGASGDSNAILRALIEGGYTGRALIPIVDAPAVAVARAAGIGATITVPLGGNVDPARFPPLTVTARVRLLSDGRFINESHGTIWEGGDTAVLEAGTARIVATSRAVSLYDRSLFRAHGQDPRHFDLVIVKSPHCQPYMFRDWADLYLNVDAPGSTSANLRRLGHTACARPIFPLDPEVPFEPRARLYRRER